MKTLQNTLGWTLFTTVGILAFFAIVMPAFAQNTGSIWTTDSCPGGVQNANTKYAIGDTVYIRGEGFATGTPVNWKIEGKPGNASADPGDVVASGSEPTDDEGNFCFAAYVVADDDAGEYSVTAGKAKGDNYRVGDCTDNCIIQKGSITIYKATDDDSGDATAFDFTFDGDTYSAEPFDVNGDESDSEVFSDLPVGDYTITELAENGWTFDGVDCNCKGFTPNLGGSSVSIILGIGENVECTFYNKKDTTPTPSTTGNIHFIKEVDTAVTEDTTFDFVLTDPTGATTSFNTLVGTGNVTSNTQDFNNTPTGDYSVVELSKNGWVYDYVSCVGDSQTVDIPMGTSFTLAADEDMTCTFYNNKDTSSNNDPWCSFAGTIIDHTEDENAVENDGDQVDPARRDVTAVETIADYANFDGKEGDDWKVDPLDFYSLGIGGFITYEFTDKVVFDQSGPDIGIYEITGGLATEQSKEAVLVEVSQNGTDWVDLGVYVGDAAIDISSAGLPYVKYIRLTDQSQGVQGSNGDGYDVDGIVILQGSCGDEPRECTVTILSDNTAMVEEKGTFAMLLSTIHSAWTAAIDSAKWIWGDNPVVDPTADETQTFVNKFGWNGTVDSATLYVASDNTHTAEINGTLAGEATEADNFRNTTQDEYDVTSLIQQGNNKLMIAVDNIGVANSTPTSNPAGVMYRLDITTTDTTTCSVPYTGDDDDDDSTDTETVTICKIDGTAGEGNGVPYLDGWDMELTNGTTTYNLTTDTVTGCVSQVVDPEKGPWIATEVATTTATWNLVDMDVTGGTEDGTSCTFFDNQLATVGATALVAVVAPTYECTFVNAQPEPGPYDECLPVVGGNTNLLTNGSFENETITDNGGLWQWFASILGWTEADGEDMELQNHWSGNDAAAGEQYMELDADYHSNTISQSFTSENGATYKLWWAFAPRTRTLADENYLGVLINGTQVATEGPMAGIGVLTDNDWIHSSTTFTGNGADMEIAFEDLGTKDSGQGTFLDDIYLCKIADPQSSGDDDDDDDSTTVHRGGGTCSNCDDDDDDDDNTPSGRTRGDTDDKSSSDTGKPEGQVEGDTDTRAPLGAPNTGAGGASPSTTLPLFALMSIMLGAAILRMTPVHE